LGFFLFSSRRFGTPLTSLVFPPQTWFTGRLKSRRFFLGGFSAGFSVPSKSGVFKATLFGLWVLSDTVLSVIFLVNPKLYTDYPPYSPSELQIVGVAMILFMNVIVAIVIYLYTKSVYATLGEKAID